MDPFQTCAPTPRIALGGPRLLPWLRLLSCTLEPGIWGRWSCSFVPHSRRVGGGKKGAAWRTLHSTGVQNHFGSWKLPAWGFS